MRLKDLVHRSALRTRSAGDTEIAAPPVAFEVTDLLIPSGTDWSADPGHLFGTVEVPVMRTYYWAFALRVSAPVGADVRLYIGITENDEWIGAQTWLGGDAPQTNRLWDTKRGSDVAGETAFGAGNPITSETVTIGASLETSGPTPADIHVVSARVAFLVI